MSLSGCEVSSFSCSTVRSLPVINANVRRHLPLLQRRRQGLFSLQPQTATAASHKQNRVVHSHGGAMDIAFKWMVLEIAEVLEQYVLCGKNVVLFDFLVAQRFPWKSDAKAKGNTAKTKKKNKQQEAVTPS